VETNPSEEECSRAVARVVTARRSNVRADPRYTHYTDNAIAERITGVPSEPRRGRRGWWLVGRVLDDFLETDPEFDVWYRVERSGKRRLVTSQKMRPNVPDPPKRLKRYFCGLRLRWIEVDD
jgi:hypothetical protein